MTNSDNQITEIKVMKLCIKCNTTGELKLFIKNRNLCRKCSFLRLKKYSVNENKETYRKHCERARIKYQNLTPEKKLKRLTQIKNARIKRENRIKNSKLKELKL